MTTKIDTEYTEKPVCPYCGHEFQDAWEWEGNDGETDCGECDKTFNYYRDIEITYCTSKIEP